MIDLVLYAADKQTLKTFGINNNLFDANEDMIVTGKQW